VIILVAQFNKDIGLKSFTVVGVLTFGTKVMKPLLIGYRLTIPLKKSMHRS
jgi:hypothetical protein